MVIEQGLERLPATAEVATRDTYPARLPARLLGDMGHKIENSVR